MVNVDVVPDAEEQMQAPPGGNGLPAIEALQGGVELAQRFNFTDPVRGCIVSMITNGASTGKHELFHMVASDFLVRHGLDPDKTTEYLLELNQSILSKPIPSGDIYKMVRNMARRKNLYYYSCKNGSLQAYCIGSDECPVFKGTHRWVNHSISAENFLRSGWLRVLRSQETNVWLGVYHLYRLKGVGPSQPIFFTFSELERISHIGRRYIRGNLERLEQFGLITDLHIQPAGSPPTPPYGRHSSCKLPISFPPVPLIAPASPSIRISG